MVYFLFFNFFSVYLFLRERQRQSASGVEAEREKKFFNVYLFLREMECEQGRGRKERQKDRQTESEAGSQLSAQSPTWGSNSCEIMT